MTQQMEYQQVIYHNLTVNTDSTTIMKKYIKSEPRQTMGGVACFFVYMFSKLTERIVAH